MQFEYSRAFQRFGSVPLCTPRQHCYCEFYPRKLLLFSQSFSNVWRSICQTVCVLTPSISHRHWLMYSVVPIYPGHQSIWRRSLPSFDARGRRNCFRYTRQSQNLCFIILIRLLTDHVGLVNDYFSYLKEKLSNSDDTNIIRILMDHEACDYASAAKIVVNKIRQKERDFIAAGIAVINDPVLGKNPEVHRWVANLPYVMGGNNAWSQTVRISFETCRCGWCMFVERTL